VFWCAKEPPSQPQPRLASSARQARACLSGLGARRDGGGDDGIASQYDHSVQGLLYAAWDGGKMVECAFAGSVGGSAPSPGAWAPFAL
jgi:hypothetical protein